jgi:Carboxypeptidase regulatory-like domain
MKLQSFILLMYLFSGLLLFSCEGVEGPAGPALRGELIGNFSLVLDQFGKPMVDKGGIEVLVEGTTPEKKSATDAIGKFLVNDLPTGTYQLVFSKPGFQTKKVFSFQFTGGNMPVYYEAPLFSELSNTTIVGFSAEATDENNSNPAKYSMIKFLRSINPVSTSAAPRNLVAYVHTLPSVSSQSYSFSPINLTNDESIIRFDKIASGTKLYAIAYATSASCSGYYDPSLGRFVDTCIGTGSSVVEFTIP